MGLATKVMHVSYWRISNEGQAWLLAGVGLEQSDALAQAMFAMAGGFRVLRPSLKASGCRCGLYARRSKSAAMSGGYEGIVFSGPWRADS